MVFVHAIGKRAPCFSNVKGTAFITLELVDKVHRLAVCPGSYGVSGLVQELVKDFDGRVNGTGLTSGPIVESGASKGWRLVSTINWRRLRVCGQ